MPCVFEPDSDLEYGSIWCALSGGDEWGGADIYISVNGGSSYSRIGRITANAKQGLLTANLPDYSGSNPDTTDTLSVDLTESGQILQPVTHVDATSFRTLSVIQPAPIANVIQQPELISYGNVATTGTYTANLTYLYRGIYGNGHASHAIGEQFTLIDISKQSGSVLSIPLPVQYIGQTLLLKFASFNLFNLGNQDLSTLTAYQYTPTGRGYGLGALGVPLTPTGLTATAGSGQIDVSWSMNARQDNVQLYTLYAAPGLSQPFSSAVQIFSGLSSVFGFTGLPGSTSYTFFLTATNAAGTSSHTSGVNGTSGSGGVGIEVTDGTTTVTGATEINFTSGATVSAGGSGVADVSITGGGGGGGSWLPLVDGAEPPVFITDGAGVLIAVAFTP
jgi:hypothetical protein